MIKRSKQAGKITLINEEGFKTFLLKKYTSKTVETAIKRVKILARQGLLNQDFEKMELELWNSCLAQTTRGNYKNAYRRFHEWRQQA